MTVQEFITYISIVVPAIPLIAGYRNCKSLLWLFVIAGLISDILLVLVFPGKPIRAFIGNIFILVEFLCIYYYYRSKFKGDMKWVQIISVLVFITAFVVMFYEPGKGLSLLQPYKKFNWIGATLLCVPYIAFAFCGFLQIIRQQPLMQLERSPYFIVNTAFITYYSTVFLVFLFSQYLVGEDKITMFWRFLELMNIVKYLLLARALTLKTEQ